MKKIRIIYLIIVLLMFIITITSMFYLPDTISVHWTSGGIQKGSKFYLFAVPVIALITWLGTPTIFKTNRGKENSFLNKLMIWVLIPILALLNIIWIFNA